VVRPQRSEARPVYCRCWGEGAERSLPTQTDDAPAQAGTMTRDPRSDLAPAMWIVTLG